jgi:general secretion pathway protein D
VRNLALILCLLAAWTSPAAEPSAARLFAKGKKAEKAGRLVDAYLLYSEAAAMKPGNRAYWLRSLAVRSRIAEAAKSAPDAALPAVFAAPQAPPQPAPAMSAATLLDVAEAQEPLPPSHLKAGAGLRDFDLHGDVEQVYSDVARAYGLECIFDSDYPPGKPIRFQLDAVDYRTALHGLEDATASFIVPLSEKKFLVAKDTAAKRTELEPVVSVAIPMPEALTQQDFTAMYQAVQTALAIEKVGWNSQNNTVILRDRISKVLPARQMLESLIAPRAQVMMEMRILELSRNDAVAYGMNLTTQFPLVSFAKWLNNQPSLSNGLSGLLSFGGGETLFGLGVLDASLVATLSRSSSNVLLSSVLRSVDGQPASLKVGERYPIITAGYSGPTGPASVAGYIPAMTFEDLGLTLKVTPTVHNEREATLDIDAEYKVLSGTADNGIPVISNRTLLSKARLSFGQWAVVAGLLNTQEAHTISGLAGLAEVPFLGPLTSVHDRTNEDSQVLIVIRPSLLTPPPLPTPSIYVGTQGRPLTPL